MSRGDFTLGDLLGDSNLGLELLTGGEQALRTRIAGAHAIELENPAKWIDAGWMMLTMGVRLRNKPQAQRDLIIELQELGASCLGFGVGLSFKSVPVALLDEARRRDFPVILVPEESQFRDLTRAVFQSTVGIESTTFQRLSSIQQNLIRAFAEPDPLRSIVQRLGRLVNATIAVMSLDGEVDASTGAIPVADIASELSTWPSGFMAQFAVDDWKVLAAPVTASLGSSARWLVVASRRATVTEDLARAAVQVTAPLIDALLRLSATSQRQDRALRQSLLDALLDERPDALDVRTMEARIQALGVDLTGGHRSVVLRPSPSDGIGRRSESESLNEPTLWLHDRLESLGAPYLLSQRADEIVAVVAEGPALDAVARGSIERWGGLLVGVGRAVGSLSDIRTSHRDAQIVAQHLAVQRTGRVMAFDDLDVVTQLLAEVPMERFAAKAAPIAALLAQNPIQLEALRAFFAMNRDIKAAADSIFVHPNTLRYRLERLEHSLGRSLREPSVTASLYCVLTLMSDLAPEVTDVVPSAVPGEGAPFPDAIRRAG